MMLVIVYLEISIQNITNALIKFKFQHCWCFSILNSVNYVVQEVLIDNGFDLIK